MSEPIADADAIVQGTTRANLLGRSVVNIDLNGDGHEDLVIGAPGGKLNGQRSGRIEVRYGPLTSTTGLLDESGADAVFHGPGPRLEAGYSIANVGDIDNDGTDDLLIGSNATTTSQYPNGVAWLVYGGNHAGVLDLDITAGAIIEGTSVGGFGQIVAGVGDIDDDGSLDFAIGAPVDDTAGDNTGAVFVYSGPLLGAHDSSGADVTFTGREVGGRAGNAIAAAGDVDGDGVADIIIGAPRDSTAGNRAGTAFVVAGSSSLTGTVDLSTATAILNGDALGRAGSAVLSAGDVDGDGFGDLLVGSPLWGSSKRGIVELVLGGPSLFGELNLTDIYEARVKGEDAYDNMGIGLAAGKDLDGDGNLDFILGASRADGPSAAQTGGAWVITDGLSGDMVVSASSGARYAQNRYANAGFAIAMFDDLNEDGIGDFVVGAFQANIPGGAYRGGQVGVYWGGLDLSDEEEYFADGDADTWGDGAAVLSCDPVPGHVLRDGDCNDGNNLIHPFADESDCLDPVDYNCDGSVGNTDADGDGVDACEGDCDDSETLVNPAADELCADGLDNDCDGLFDDPSAVDALPWSVDGDGDGDGSATFAVTQCEDPGIFAGNVVNTGGDCDDLDPAINQFAIEVCDGVDNNCIDGIDEADSLDALAWFEDADLDGFGALASIQRSCGQPVGYVANADDCDDADDDVKPGAAEVCDYADNDCNSMFYQGGPVSFAAAGHANFSGANDESLGRAMAAIADWNGDGRDEMALGAPNNSDAIGNGGAVYVRNGTVHGGAFDVSATYANGRTDWDARILGNRNNSFLGDAIASGDVNGDGFADLLIGAPGQARPNLAQGVVFLMYGPIVGDLTQDDADAWFSGVDNGDDLGDAVDIADLDGDGFDDMIIGAPDEDGTGDRIGAAHVVYGTAAAFTSGRIDTVADATFRGAENGSDFGIAVASIGDVDGDGNQDIAIGASREGGLQTGATHIVFGTGARFSGETAVDVSLTGTRASERLGTSLSGLGDATGDGVDDLLVGTGASGNKAYLLNGDAVRWTSGPISSAASTTIQGLSLQRLGNDVAAAGDVNADGFADMLVSASDDDVAANNAGASVLLYGSDALPAVVTTEDIESKGRVEEGTTFPTYSASTLGFVEGAIFRGSAANEQAGRFVAGDGDFNGDGFRDMLFGNATANNNAGQVTAIYGGGYGVDTTGSPTAGWKGSLTVDGDSSDWTPETTLDTTSGGANIAALTWDDDNLYVGFNTTDVAGGPSQFLVIYMGDGNASGDNLGRLFNTQHPGLPFSADYYLTWRADNAYNSWDAWNGATFDRTTSWLGTNGSQWAEHNANGVVEFAIPRSAIGNPETLDLVAFWVFEGAGSETTFHGIPDSSFTNGYDPDPTEYFKLYFGESAAPSAYGSTPTGGGIPTVADDYDTWYVDADLDLQADDTPLTFMSCAMHVPIAFNSEGAPQRAAIADAGAATDCDDSNPTVYLGADDPLGDGIDQNCDGADGDASGGTNTPPFFTEQDLVEPFATDDDVVVDYFAGDVDMDPVTVSFAWYRNGVLDPAVTTDTYPAASTVKGDMIYVELTADDGTDTTTVTSNIATIVNTPPVMDSCVIAPGSPGNNDALTATAASTDADVDTVSYTYVWTVNGVVDSGQTGATYPSASTSITDVITVSCTPNDGEEDGSALTSAPVNVVNTPPTAPVVTVNPSVAYTVDPLVCTITTPSTDADGDSIVYTFAWTHNSVPYTGPLLATTYANDTVPAYALAPGDWGCEVVPFDGTNSGPAGSNGVDVVQAPDGPRDFAIGENFGCAILDSGDPICWGENNSGQLGRGHLNDLGDNLNEMQLSPVFSLSSTAQPVQISTGRYHACAILDDQSLKCWGWNGSGQLGAGNGLHQGDDPGEMGDNLATVDLGGRIPVKVDAYNEQTCVLTDVGEVLCWGDGSQGGLGRGNQTDFGSSPLHMGAFLPTVDLGTDRYAVDLEVGFFHVCVLLDDNSVKCWGDNAFGNLGTGNTADRGDGPSEMGDAMPATDLGGGHVIDLEAGARYTCALFDAGNVKCWGRNSLGQLGYGDTNSRGDQGGEMGAALPDVDLGTGRTAVALAGGGNHTCAMLDDGSTKCWGRNLFGQLGSGLADSAYGDSGSEMGDNLPILQAHQTRDVVAVAGGYDQTCVKTECGDVQCVGRNDGGALGYNDVFHRGANPRSIGDALPTIGFSNDGRLAYDADPADCTAWEHSITVDGDLSDWLPEETFNAGVSGTFYVTWDADTIYVATQHADVSGGGFEHNFLAYFGNGTDDPADPSFAGFTEGRDLNTQTPGFAIEAQTYVHWRADNSFVHIGNAEWPFAGLLGPVWGEYPYFTPPLQLPGYAHAENEAQNAVEFAIPRDEIYLYQDQHPVLYIQSHWAFEGAGFESSYNAVPDDSFTDGYDPDFGTALRLELDHPDGPATGTSVPAILP